MLSASLLSAHTVAVHLFIIQYIQVSLPDHKVDILCLLSQTYVGQLTKVWQSIFQLHIDANIKEVC